MSNAKAKAKRNAAELADKISALRRKHKRGETLSQDEKRLIGK